MLRKRLIGRWCKFERKQTGRLRLKSGRSICRHEFVVGTLGWVLTVEDAEFSFGLLGPRGQLTVSRPEVLDVGR